MTDANNNPSVKWSGVWDPLGTPLFGDPVVVRNGDGRLEVFMIGNNYTLFHMWQQTQGSSNQWSAWDPVGGITGWSPRKRPAVALNPDYILELFMMGPEGQLWHTWQTSTNSGKWPSNWTQFGTPPIGTQWPPGNNPAIGRNQDGRLELFMRGYSGGYDRRTWHTWQTSKNNTGTWDWSPWKLLGV